jgi:TRAP-type mannitol/chloroaromatic compound transport system permease small subunit
MHEEAILAFSLCFMLGAAYTLHVTRQRAQVRSPCVPCLGGV